MVNAGKERRKRILVVNDDHELRSLIQALLEEEAYEVETAIDGVDAFEHLDHHWNAYDVILLDLTMPRLNGLQFLQKIQEHDPTLLRSIIALSAIPGLGMGLYIVAEIVKRHGGSITVDSEVGNGSTFTVTFPTGGMPE
ncbi:MAG TPA: response regulator, partial [Ktedonobacteraceae bacterium]|nr:response regulator [Ktedonobacteraceae bacterium]